VHVPVVIVGAGPGGLAMSHVLTAAGIEHVVLERDEVASSWRRERWDSLRLLTPNWMTTLPGASYDGDDPDGFMAAREVVALLDEYRRRIAAPVHTGVAVDAVHVTGDGFDVSAAGARWQCDVVVAASGGSSEPHVPALASDVPHHVEQLTALQYRRPAQISGAGRVLVVGASASGVQLADELAAAGHDVTLAVGEHVRLPRSYRGRDIYWWLDCIGQLDERYDEVDDIQRARRHASIQVVGSDDGREVDLNALRDAGVTVVGRLMGIAGTRLQCSGSLANLVKNADLKQARLLRRADELVTEQGLDAEVGPVRDPRPTSIGDPPTELELRDFSTVIWATGYRPSYPWLPDEARDRKGRLAHDGGVGALAGLFVLGLPFLRRRRSNLIAGLGQDAADLLPPVRARLDACARARTVTSRRPARAASA
jgi:putative flavoprotein involved in K+ transport